MLTIKTKIETICVGVIPKIKFPLKSPLKNSIKNLPTEKRTVYVKNI